MIVGEYIGLFNPAPFRDEMPLHLMTRLYLAFALIDEKGLYWQNESKVLQVIKRTKEVNPKAEVFASVQDDVGLLRGAFDPGFPKKVLTFLQKYRLDGLDLDWEENLEERALSHLIKNLSSILRPNKLKLTLAAWSFWNAAYNASIFKIHLDQINLMSYGLQVDLNQVIDDFVGHGVPTEQLIGGVITEPYLPGTDSTGPNGSIVEKVEIARKRNLAGMMAWRLDNDRPNYEGAHQLWDAVMNPY